MSSEITELENSCNATIDRFKRELARMRSGRAHSGMIDSMMVEYYGSQVPLKQLGLVNSPEPRLLTIQVYDAGAVKSIEKALQQSDLGLNPSSEGTFIRINIPALTEDRRKEMVKSLHKLAEDMKISVRGHRRDAIDSLKTAQKNGEIPEDDLYRGQDEVQKVTDKYVKIIDDLLVQKEADMMEV